MALEQALSADEQAQMDAMRAADAQPGSEATTAAPQPPLDPQAPSATPPAAEPATGDAQPQQTKMVPHAALHEERELRKEAEKRLNEERSRWENRFNQIIERFPQTQPQQPAQPATQPVPEFAADPVGHIVGTMQQQGATLQQIVGALQGFGQRTQQQEAVAALQQRSSALERQFAAETPDYTKATEHLTAARHRELEAMGYTDAAQRQGIINQDALTVAAHAIEQNRNPAEVFYSLAKQRGYATTPTPAPAAQAEPEAQQNAGERLRNVAAGQQQARSLSDVRGSAPAQMNATRLLEMTDSEFAKALETPEGMALLGS